MGTERLPDGGVNGEKTMNDNTAERRASVPFVEMREGIPHWREIGGERYVRDETLEAIYMAAQRPRPLTFGSLFAGIGGIDLGLERAGMQCAWQVEIDDYATKVLAKHWPDVPRFRDVRDVGAANLACVDLIAGGFPCQDISYAGKGAGLSGARSGLWFEFARIIRDLRPRYILVENVAALLDRGMGAVLGTLASIGYDAEWHCIPAASIGAPHRRDRLFLVAYTAGEHVTLHRSAQERDQAPAQDTPRGLVFSQRIQRSWGAEPELCRVADGLPAELDRLRGLGNAVVPQVAEFIGRQIVAFDRPGYDPLFAMETA